MGPVQWETDQEEPDPLEVFPATLRFEASVAEGQPALKEFTIRNNLEDELFVWGYADVGTTVDCAEQFEIFHPWPNPWTTLPPGQEMTVSVLFHPGPVEHCDGEILVNDEVLVDLSGDSLRPRMSYSSFPDFEAQVGCEECGHFTLRNTHGTEPLVIEGYDDSAMSAFSIQEMPKSIPEGEERRIVICFDPNQAGPAEPEVLRLHLNDPDTPELQVLLTGEGTDELGRTETWHYGAGDGVLVLVLVDDEDNRAAYQDRIEDGLEALVSALRERGIAYNIAGVSTEDACPGEPAFAAHHQEASVAVEALVGALFDSTDTPYADRLLELARLALDNTDPDECLDGFLEVGQPLHAIFFTPREDQSELGYSAEIASLRAAADVVVLSAVVPYPGTSCGEAPQAYSWATSLTGGELLDLCATRPEWEAHWQALAAATGALESGPTAWILEEEPASDTVRVSVDGEVLSEDLWRYDTDLHQVRILPELEDGAEVSLRYTPASACP